MGRKKCDCPSIVDSWLFLGYIGTIGGLLTKAHYATMYGLCLLLACLTSKLIQSNFYIIKKEKE